MHVKNTGRRSRPAAFAIRAAEDPDQIPMHRAVIRAKPVDQRLDIELCRFAAHRVPAIDVEEVWNSAAAGAG